MASKPLPRAQRRPSERTPDSLRAVAHLVWLGLVALLALAAVNIISDDTPARLGASAQAQGLDRAA